MEQTIEQRTPEYLIKKEGSGEGEDVQMFSKEDQKNSNSFTDLIQSFYEGGYQKQLVDKVLALEKSEFPPF